ncbi:MAG: hypothetical protein KJ645_10000 [Planctomycetes bacterium]|nr:hypothetical protein [Planctomycetota bacterium]
MPAAKRLMQLDHPGRIMNRIDDDCTAPLDCTAPWDCTALQIDQRAGSPKPEIDFPGIPAYIFLQMRGAVGDTATRMAPSISG